MRWFQLRKGVDQTPTAGALLNQRRYLHPWDKTLRAKYLQIAQDYKPSDDKASTRQPVLPPLRLSPSMTSDEAGPPIDPASTLNVKHDTGGIGDSSLVLEVSSCYLTSAEDVPTIYAFVKCVPSAVERVTSFTVSFDLVESNRVLDLWPREVLGPVNEVGMTVKENKVAKGKLKAEVAVDSLHVGGGLEQESGKEVEKSFVIQTQTSINGLIRGTEARWVLMEDSLRASGLPTETALRMKVRYKPREIRCSYCMAVSKNGSSRQYEGKTTLLFP